MHITAILEDTQIVMTARDGYDWKGHITDGMTGKTVDVEASHEEMSAIFAIALHGDGEPQGVGGFYAILTPWLAKYGMEEGEFTVCRPIP